MTIKQFAQPYRLVAIGLISVLISLLHWFNFPVFSASQPAQIERFNQVWETINENFFDPAFNGVDWNAMRDRYAPLVSQANSSDETATLINQMLSELQTSHTRFYTPDEPEYYQILGIFAPRSSEFREELAEFFPEDPIEYTDIGIVTTAINGETFIRAILDGSPAAESGLQVGDRILSVENQPFHPFYSFEGKANQPVTVQIQRSADPASQQTIEVTPKQFDVTTMYLDAQAASIDVMERNGKKIGYIHIWSYAGDQYQQLLEEELLYGRLSEADGLVLDLREGWGGAPPTALNIYTARGPSITSILRDGRQFTRYPYWNKPVVMLVNDRSRSAKEILAYGFQQYGIGQVVGETTAGAVVAGRPFLMRDGSVLYVAVTDVYVDGNERLEGVGVTPDVVVPFPVEYAQGADPQKERAIEVVLEQVQ
ncbi:peptidase S41 [filamentous cyanobacterium CCP1]|nr:peptidase S41 [filamentous cyanobacterium CCP2]PSB68510.1 peptidase S41 [filamentous cyanobacterium CCP1]